MRNLKKILALVLALVMSLSLMATASAADTTADAAANSLAVGVLKGLDIVKGDKDTGALRLDQPISRAEVAALMYRISTADVEDKEFTRYNGEFFKDVKDIDWYSGYVNYCWIAEIVNGDPAGYFAPNDKIDGYATLAMILRALGYGKNGEFKGDGWEVRTASKAKELGILDGIGDTQLRGEINRALVFEILFRALRQDEVKFNVQYPNNYESVGTTLGQRMFGLEEVTGVIKANQWANLDGASVLGENTTKMTVRSTKPADTALYGKDITLSVATTLDAVGMAYTAYMADPDKDGVKTVLTDLTDAGTNTVAFNNGEPYAAAQKLAATKSLSFNDGTEYYLNYNGEWYNAATSKWLVRYTIAKSSVNAAGREDWAAFIAKIDAKEVDGHTVVSRDLLADWDVNEDGTIDTKDIVDCWSVSIRIGKTITEEDLDIMYEIFDTADKIGDTSDKIAILPENTAAIGEVYVGTSSLEDKSDVMSWEDFDTEYLNHKDVNKYEGVNRGDSLRVISNDGDGVAEYVLKVTYTQTKAVDTYKGELAFLGGLIMANYSGNTLYNPDGLTADDLGVVVNYTIIDKKLSVYEAEKLTDKISAKNYRIPTVTTDEGGETLNQSDIENNTGLEDKIINLPEKTTYNLYLDEFRNIRSFEKVGSKQYALLTEVYDEGSQNWNYVNTNKVTVEAVLAEDEVDENNAVAVKEYPESSAGVFYSMYDKQENAWTSRIDRYKRNDRLNFLQPATAHLGVDGLFNGHTIALSARYTNNIWERDVFDADTIVSTDMANGTIGVFNYGNVAITATGDYTPTIGNVVGTSNGSFSFTNVAKYTEDDGKLTLSTASEVYINQDSEEAYRATRDFTVGTTDVKRFDIHSKSWWEDLYPTKAAFDAAVTAGDIYQVYATDYVQLDVNSGNLITAGGRHFTIDGLYGSTYKALYNTYVDTLSETVFYVVTPSTVYRLVGYTNFVSFLTGLNETIATINAGGNVRAAYAVAQNTSKDANKQDYWVADVVVIEIDAIGNENGPESVALMYNNPSERTGGTQKVESLEAEWRALQPDSDDEAQMDIYPESTAWKNHSWKNNEYGFYAVYGHGEVANGEMNVENIERIPYGQYNANGIYAGVIRRSQEIINDAHPYVDVELVGRTYNPLGDTTHYQVKYNTDDGTWDTPIYRITTDGTDCSVENLYLTNYKPTSTVQDGDRVIVVVDSDGNTAFIVDLGVNDTAVVGIKAVDYNIPEWLDQQWWMVAIEQTFTNASGANASAATISALVAAVNGLYNAVKTDDVTYATKLVAILRANGKGYDPNVNLTLRDINGVNIDDLVAGLTGAYNSLVDYETAQAAVEALIDKDVVALIQALIPAFDTVDEIIAANPVGEPDKLVRDMAGAAKTALLAADSAAAVKAIMDPLQGNIDEAVAARNAAITAAKAVIEEYKPVVDAMTGADAAAAAAALADLNAALALTSGNDAAAIADAVATYEAAIAAINGAAVAAAQRAAAVARAEAAIAANATAVAAITNPAKAAAAAAAQAALEAVIADATKTADEIDAAIATYQAAIDAALEPDPIPPTPGVEIPDELEESIVETPMTETQVESLNLEADTLTTNLDEVVDADTQEYEVVSASKLTIDPDAFTSKTLSLPYVTEGNEVPVVAMTTSQMASAGIKSIAVVRDNSPKSVSYAYWIIKVTLFNASELPDTAIEVTVANVEIIDKPVANVTVSAAILNDNAGSVAAPLAEDYTAVLNSANNTITVSAKNVKAHQNANNASGKWVGFQIALTATQPATWTQVEFSQNDASATKIALETNLDTNDGANTDKGIAFYFNSANALSPVTVTVTFLTADGANQVVSSTVTYNVVFNVTAA